MRKLNQKGSVLIFLTLGFALLGTFIGFALDFGRAYLEKARIARLVDGAALAAAKVLKGQSGYENVATQAACDSMLMNGAKVAMSGNSCAATSGANLTVTLNFFDAPVAGGPPMRYIQVTGTEPMPTTFLRFLGFMVPGDFSTINIAATAQAAPERPIDLMLVLDRSGSMGPLGGTDAAGRLKIDSLKIAVNAFLGLSNTFSANDRIGMNSFASRGCGNASGGESTATTCTPDVTLDFATSSYISTLQNKVNGLVANNGTNTMEALRTARVPLAQAFNDPTRTTTRKAVLLVTDGQPTFMKRDTDTQCNSNPLLPGNALPSPGGTGGPAAGCIHGVPTWKTSSQNNFMVRGSLATPSSLTRIPGSPATDPTLYKNVIQCTRAITGCVTNGAMFEANEIRNCGVNNAACGAGGNHDVVFYAIAIGQPTSDDPQSSMDKNAKCLLARMANATDILNTRTGIVETLTNVCTGQITTVDGDTHADLNQGWPSCATGAPCINSSQEKGKVFVVDVTGDVTAQLNQVFQEIAALLKLRLVL